MSTVNLEPAISAVSQPNEDGDGLEAAIDQAIAACDGDPRAAVLESEIADLKKAVSHAYMRGRFRSYTG